VNSLDLKRLPDLKSISIARELWTDNARGNKKPAAAGFRTLFPIRLLQNSVGRMPGLYVAIDRKPLAGYGTKPDFVIAFALPLEIAAVLL
jgi:hypothetical protein